jgi:hypothetical protein
VTFPSSDRFPQRETRRTWKRLVAFISAALLACTLVLATAPVTNAATLYLCTKGWQRVYTTSPTWLAMQFWYCRPA